ncbi:hypothetical protein U1Q18_039617 [Sarracenia purpurea var. burkii]
MYPDQDFSIIHREEEPSVIEDEMRAQTQVGREALASQDVEVEQAPLEERGAVMDVSPTCLDVLSSFLRTVVEHYLFYMLLLALVLDNASNFLVAIDLQRLSLL